MESGGRPNFFIVGATRCGTTSMYEYLRTHPGVFMPGLKEPYYFGSDLHFRRKRISLDRYLLLFRESAGKKAVGEASPMYVYSKTSAEEIKRFNRNARIIIMLRDPVEQMYSAHSKNVSSGFENLPDFWAALAAEGERVPWRGIPPGCQIVETLHYRKVARYRDQVARYLKAFGREGVHFVLLDDLVEDPRWAYAGVLRFLELDERSMPQRFEVHNENKSTRSGLANLSVHLLSEAVARNLGAVSDSLLDATYSKVLVRARRLVEGNYRKVPRRAMDPGLRERLCREYAKEVESLGALIDRDLGNWCDPAPS